MELQILREEKDLIEVKVVGEDHTICNLLRSQLWSNEETSIASYNLKHPLVSSPILILKVNKGKPRKILLDAVQAVKEKNKELRALLPKLS